MWEASLNKPFKTVKACGCIQDKSNADKKKYVVKMLDVMDFEHLHIDFSYGNKNEWK